MRLWTITPDRTLWKNHLARWCSPLSCAPFSEREYSQEECAAFEFAASSFVLENQYRFYAANSYTENGWTSVLYHKLPLNRLLICEGRAVGVLFITRCSDSDAEYHADALFFEKANPNRGES